MWPHHKMSNSPFDLESIVEIVACIPVPRSGRLVEMYNSLAKIERVKENGNHSESRRIASAH